MEFVNDNIVKGRRRTLPKGSNGKDFGSATKYGSIRVHGCIPGHHPDKLGRKVLAKSQEFLIHERFHGASVDADSSC